MWPFKRTDRDVAIELLGRAGLRYRDGERQMVVDSEILAGPKSAMCVWRSSIQSWDPPHQGEPVTDGDRDRIIEDIRRFVRAGGEDIDVI